MGMFGRKSKMYGGIWDGGDYKNPAIASTVKPNFQKHNGL